ncbi:hypothetical protein GE09DRAFT_975414 [Coniochaeta sp. 2T2.1]|nr:hypothetical protein GE09DRAFT_975414 [Coniochaeta sp. 2T2.1]
MKYQAAITLASIGLAAAGPVPHQLKAREVPQEHSHNIFLDMCNKSLKLNNPKNILDCVFALLGDAAAANGAGDVTNLACLQQETADQAFTNAKAAGDIPGMAGALCYRALERNTGKVGQASAICTETAVNPEIDAITQHQDPASANAATINKGIAIELAKQLASIGADPLLALETGTFAPGNLNDNTGKGNSCDTDPSDPGCIFTDRLLVLDASDAEISSAVAGITPTFTGTGQFTGALGAAAPAVTQGTGSRPFTVNGNTFVNLGAAITRSCDIQKNLCANAANSGAISGGVGQCEQQRSDCEAANNAGGAAKLAKFKRALDFGTCGDPTIVFESGLDGRNTDAFIAADQASFNHGSALNIAVIAGFICQRLDSSCKAGADVVASCTSASAAAVATTQNQAAADVFNNMMGVGGGAGAGTGAVATTTTAAAGKATASAVASSVVMTITQCA